MADHSLNLADGALGDGVAQASAAWVETVVVADGNNELATADTGRYVSQGFGVVRERLLDIAVLAGGSCLKQLPGM
jgi:hypothetical protein